MTRNATYGLMAATMMAAMVLGTGCDDSDMSGSAQGAMWGDGSGAPVAESLDADDLLAQDLRTLREEEKLARDVYLRLGERWDHPSFVNIARSEQQHMDAVGELLMVYGVEDPVAIDEVGLFEDEVLGGLYEVLVEQGERSLVDGLVVGATIEDLDIQDIKDMESRTDEAAVLSVYRSLKCGSGNHLRAYTRQLTSNDVDYTPQYIDAGTYEVILAGEQGACR